MNLTFRMRQCTVVMCKLTPNTIPKCLGHQVRVHRLKRKVKRLTFYLWGERRNDRKQTNKLQKIIWPRSGETAGGLDSWAACWGYQCNFIQNHGASRKNVYQSDRCTKMHIQCKVGQETWCFKLLGYLKRCGWIYQEILFSITNFLKTYCSG